MEDGDSVLVASGKHGIGNCDRGNFIVYEG